MINPLPFQKSINQLLLERNLRRNLKRTNWNFSDFRVDLILRETSEWERYYLPVCVSGKTVLDIGAGEGESARFYLLNGAKKVVCIEPCLKASKYLYANEKAYSKSLQVFNKRFSLDDLRIPCDFIKCDIEGYEEPLLNVRLNVPAVVEVHGLQLRDRFAAAGWHVMNPKPEFSEYGCGAYAYWKCKPLEAII